jgi:hypothetical protein
LFRSLTQPPTLPETPIAASKKASVPEPDCGRNGLMVAFLPPTWFQLVSVQV